MATISDSSTESAATNQPESVQEKATNEHVIMDDVQRHIKNLLIKNVKLDDIYNYISVSPSVKSAFVCAFPPHFRHFNNLFLVSQANVTEIDNNFIRALTTAVVDSSLDNRFKLNDKHFLQRIPLLERYIDGNEQSQVQCLIAIQILILRLEHPQGMCS